MANKNEFVNTVSKGAYTSFSGADITAVIGDKMVGTLQAISYSVTREKGPIYTMRGSADPLAFARGKRAVAGTLIFLTIDEQAFLGHMNQTKEGKGSKFYASKSDIKYDYSNNSLDEKVNKNDLFKLFEQQGADNFDQMVGTGGAGYEKDEANAWYADQVLPFDVNISAANEYGQAMKKSFVGCEILNEGGGISIDDLVVEEQYTYICRGMTKWTKVLNAGQSKPAA